MNNNISLEKNKRNIMADFKFNKTSIEGVYIIEPQVFGDNRGYFMETYHKEVFSNGERDCSWND